MKIKVNGKAFDVALLEDRVNEVRVRVPLTTDLDEFKSTIEGAGEIEYYAVDKEGNESLVFKVFTKCALDNISRGKDCFIFNFKKITREAELEEQVTNLELALVELYESIGG
jgi:hypothetical protein